MDLLIDQKTQDLKIVGGQLTYTTNNPDELMQRLWLRLKTFKRNWFWNTDYGIDYINDVFGVNRNKWYVDAIIIGEIGKDALALEITNFSSDISDYRYSCQFSVTTKSNPSPVVIYYLVNENGVYLTDEYGQKLFTEY